MHQVKVLRHWLLKVVTENQKKHKDAYAEAFEGYRKECIRVLEENLLSLRKGEHRAVLLLESAPEDHSKEYKRVIGMLTASVDEEVVLSQHEFAQYVEDDWGWKESWVMANSKYMGSR